MRAPRVGGYFKDPPGFSFVHGYDDERARAPGADIHHGATFAGAVVVLYGEARGDLAGGSPV